MFRAPAMLLPHESTVAHEQRFIMDAPIISRTKSSNPTASIVIDSPIAVEESNKQTDVSINLLQFWKIMFMLLKLND